MSLADTDKPRDPLATLRIKRGPAPVPTRSPGRWWRRLVLFLIVLGLIGGGLAAAYFGQSFSVLKAFEPRLEVRVANVSVFTGRAADAVVVATGYLESRRQAKIGARAPGRIQLLNVEEGSRVTKGQLLAELEHADLDASLAANRAQVEQAKAGIVEQAVAIERTAREYDRAVKLQPTRAISETELDVAKFEHDAAVAKMESLKAAVSLAEARVREAEQVKENMFVRAPFDGTVISKDAEVGESILPGGMGESSGRGSVVTIADLSQLEMDCDVKEDYIGRVVVDRIAEVAIDAVPGRRYKGKVRKVIPMGDRARATIKVKVAITDADERLFPDMSGTVYFLPDANSEAADANIKRVFCSTAAIRKDRETEVVWTVADDRVKRTTVRTGTAGDGRTEILNGLAGGERVVVEPPPDLRDGQQVKVVE